MEPPLVMKLVYEDVNKSKIIDTILNDSINLPFVKSKNNYQFLLVFALGIFLMIILIFYIFKKVL